MNNLPSENQISRLRSSLAGSPLSSSLSGVFAFTVSALVTYILASLLGGSVWFSLILGMTIGSLGFCATRIWLDENSFDSPNTNAYVIMAGVLSFIGIILAYITMNMFPFGDHTVLIIDMHHQYVTFFTLLRDKLLGAESLIYSDSLGLGAGFIPLWAYYLASPFSLITLLFPRDMITEALLVITVLKITSAGVTFSIFARHKFGRNDFSIVIGGVAFSMMSFFIGHSWNLMWLDPIILLPLIALGLEKLLKGGKPTLYCITLAMALITNYYTGYMVCIFMVIYFFAYIISEKNTTPHPNHSEGFWKAYRIGLISVSAFMAVAILACLIFENKLASIGIELPNKALIIGAAIVVIAILASYYISVRFWRFCYASLIGGGMSALVIIPAFISLMDTSGADDSFARALASNFSFFELFPRALFSAAPSMRGDSLPNIYCSVLALVLLAMFLTCSAIPLRRRVAWGGVVGVMGFSMSFNWLNFAWHGFHFPNDLPYRFSFLMSFAMLCVAMQTLDKISKLKPRAVCLSAVIIASLILVEQQFGSEADFVMIYVSLAGVLVYSLIVALHAAGKLRQSLCFALLAIFLFAEVAANASVELTKLDSKEYYTERANFVDDYEVNKLAFDKISSFKEDSPEEMMYREELLPRKTCNDPSLMDYSGMTVFASSNRRSVTTLMGKLGYAVNGVNSYLYKNFVPVSDSLLGLKYIALGHQISGHQQLVDAGSVSDSEGFNSRYLYQNSYALNKAFMVSRGIINWQWENDNPFIVQNDLIHCATGADDVYELIYLESDNTTYDEADGTYVNSASGTSVSEFNCTVDISGTYFTCSRISDSLTSNFTATQIVPKEGQTYVYVDCRAGESITVSAGSTTVNTSPTEPYIVDLGYLTAGTEVSVTIYTDMSCGGNIFMATLNNENFDTAMSSLQGGMLKADKYREGYISGTVDSAIDGMMFTSIPFDGGWTVKVDGEKVDTFALGDGFLCFAVPQGTHTVTMSYFPIGFVPGIIITVFCLAVFILMTNRKTREWFAAHKPAILETVPVSDDSDEYSPVEELSSMQPVQRSSYQGVVTEGFETVDFSSLSDEPELFRDVNRAPERPAPRQPQYYTTEQPRQSQQPQQQKQPQQSQQPQQQRPSQQPLPSGFEQFFNDEE